MQNTLSRYELQDEELRTASRIEAFFKQFLIADLARRCEIQEIKGYFVFRQYFFVFFIFHFIGSTWFRYF